MGMLSLPVRKVQQFHVLVLGGLEETYKVNFAPQLCVLVLSDGMPLLWRDVLFYTFYAPYESRSGIVNDVKGNARLWNAFRAVRPSVSTAAGDPLDVETLTWPSEHRLVVLKYTAPPTDTRDEEDIMRPKRVHDAFVAQVASIDWAGWAAAQLRHNGLKVRVAVEAAVPSGIDQRAWENLDRAFRDRNWSGNKRVRIKSVVACVSVEEA